MKNYYLPLTTMLIILFSLNDCMYSQKKAISKEEAWKIVQKEILLENVSNINVSVSINEIPSTAKIKILTKEITAPFQSWCFFIDSLPNTKWGHPCKYAFVNSKSGDVKVVREFFPPIDDMQMLLREKFSPSKTPIKKTTNLSKGICSNSNDYAILISGGGSKNANIEASWNDCSSIYSSLVNNYHLTDDHIFVIMSDGTNPANDMTMFDGSYASSPLDLDGDGDNDIDYSATYSNLITVFSILSNTLDSDDNLLIFVYDHGKLVNADNQQANIVLWDPYEITDAQFANQVSLVNAGQIFVLMNQCYSGAFIGDLAANNRVITTACGYNENSFWDQDLGQSNFTYEWVSAVDGITPHENTVDADYDDNGVVSASEAFYYAQTNDTEERETPQYSSSPSNLGSYLSLSGKIPYISGDNMVCYSSNKTFNLNNYPQNMNVTWTCSQNLYPYSSTNTSYTVHANSSTSTGLGWVQAYITDPNGNCNPVTPITVRYSPWVGIPELGYISGPYEGTINTNYNYYAYPYNMEAMATYFYSANPSSYSNYVYSNYSDIIYWEPDFYSISVRAENTCGTTDWIYTSTSINSGGEYMVFPNPATDIITITYNNSTKKLLEPDNTQTTFKVNIFDMYGKIYYSGVKSGVNFTIPISNLRQGQYYIRISEGKKASTLRFIKN